MFGRHLFVPLALALAGCWGLSVGWIYHTGGAPFLDRLEATLSDMRTVLRGPIPAGAPVTIVAIDDATVAAVGRYPLPRAILADLVARVAALGPSATAIDILLIDAGNAEEDERLATALAASPTVIAAAAVFPQKHVEAMAAGALAGVPVADRLLLPRDAFTRAASIGVVNLGTGGGGVPQHVPMLFRTADRIEASMALRAAAIALQVEPEFVDTTLRIGERAITLDRGLQLPLSFYGPRGSIATVSGADIMAGRISPARLAGRVAVIGSTVTGGGDVFPTPFDPVLPGVEVIATGISHVLAGDGLHRTTATRRADMITATLLPILVVALIAWRRNAAGLWAAAGVVVLWAIGNTVAFGNGIWLGASAPLAAALPPAVLFGAAQLWLGRSNAAHFEAQSVNLQRIQAPGLARILAGNPDFLTEPLPFDAAVVFVDLSGFTGLSETLGPAATRELLDGFYDLVDAEVTAANGAVTSFMGDGVMILFGLPVPSAMDAAHAVLCCTRICIRLDEWLGDHGRSALSYKVGAHFGPVVASRLGHGATQQIATTGDTVNIAARLMEVAAERDAKLAMSAQLLDAAGRDALTGVVLRGPLQTRLRGRSGLLSVYLWNVETASATQT